MSLRRSAAGLVALCFVLLGAAGCGGSGSGTAHGTGAGGTETAVPQPVSNHKPDPAGPEPSSSARLICSSELQTELHDALGETPLHPPTATWADHLYTCTYDYSSGRLVLSVKEESSWPETLGYYHSLGKSLGVRKTLGGLGEGAYVTSDGSVVVRKDWRILLVNIAGLPAEWAKPPTSRANIALTVTDAILACWRGY